MVDAVETGAHGRAVVIGASVAGLLAAGAASKTFDEVVVIERDELEDTIRPRKGAPQGAQIHSLLPAGLEHIQEIFPDFRMDLVAAGGLPLIETAEIATLTSSGWRKRVDGAEWIASRRPVLELVMRKRLVALPNVRLVKASVTGLELSVTDIGKAVAGVKLRDGSIMTADLVINATGRRTKAIDWLAEHGVDAPRESFCNTYLGYSTQYVRLPEGLFNHGVAGISAQPFPTEGRGGVIFPADNGLYALTAVGLMRDYPGRDLATVVDFLRTSVCPAIADIAAHAEPVTDAEAYAVDGSLRRHWHEISNLPDRFITIGDAAASMNPTYGQGMSLAAVGAAMIQRHLAKAGTLEGVASLIQNDLAPVLDAAFTLVAASDSQTNGAEWSDDFVPLTPLEKRRAAALEGLATECADIAQTINTALFHLAPELLNRPDIIAACDAWIEANRTPSPFNRMEYPSGDEAPRPCREPVLASSNSIQG